MALDDTYHPAARYVGRDSNQKVFAVACGHNTCESPLATYPGRFVGFESGDPLYAVASECCQPPLLDPGDGENTDPGCYNATNVLNGIYTHPFMVEKDHFPPRGVSRVIRVRMHAAVGCADKDCLASYLIYNEPASHTTACSQTVPSGHGWWSGCVGGLTIEAYINESEQLVVCYSGCDIAIPGSFILAEASSDCFFTDTAGAGGQIAINDCCDCYDPNEFPPGGIITLTFRGYCGLHFQGRFVGHDGGGTPVYAVGNCCMPDPCQPFTQDCCLALRHCDVTVELAVTGCCSDLSGVYTFVPVDHSTFPLSWQPSAGSISACGLSWQFTLFCEADPVTGDPSFRMAVQTPGQGCSCVASNHWEVIPQPCLPLEVTWGTDLSVTCTDTDPYNPPECCNPTIGITVTF